MGFGLFVPSFRAEFGLSDTAVGTISSLGFGCFFVALLAAQRLLLLRGPKRPVLTGLAFAVVGLATIAAAPDRVSLALGVGIAAASAGFTWTPFSTFVQRRIAADWRPAALSEISTGTSVGVAVAGLAALGTVFTGFDWRICWAGFALAAVAVLAGNAVALRRVGPGARGGDGPSWRIMLRRAALPLYVLAFVFGTASAVYLAFAADVMAQSGLPGLPGAAVPGLVYLCYGLFGLSGLMTGRLRDALGLPMLLRLVFAAGSGSLLSIALLPGSWVGLVASAGLQGIFVMMTSAILAFWSDRLFPERPSLGFTAAILAMAAGSVAGPALAGLASDAFGGRAMFLAAALLPGLAALSIRGGLVGGAGGRSARTARA
ncbi:MFS transporter [Jannaschia ovalis]|uniref:YbfB/YjiJ family MFS transporter n=1 Tax=Jannaschia ovalis TaxID=3038773 RepID=A0ABY8L8C4_9RHOB|nr:MFS transporter [Jannaschia sp. GRR-S6-38]WGH77556.1 YbfB/YjiJ family MFS transporter [Jannaschia sp. GRR-S6-38]